MDPENSPLRYSISGQHLSVDPSSGLITLIKSIDREEQSSMEVVISITGKYSLYSVLHMFCINIKKKAVKIFEEI